MNFQRVAKHLLMTHWQVKRSFPPTALAAIEKAIVASERVHDGQIRFAVEGALQGEPLDQGQSSRERAIEVFSQLRMWDTECRNGVLIYLLLADRAVEIVADRGVHTKVGVPEWEALCRKLETRFKQGIYEAGVVEGIQVVTEHLQKHFPVSRHRGRELPDIPVVL